MSCSLMRKVVTNTQPASEHNSPDAKGLAGISLHNLRWIGYREQSINNSIWRGKFLLIFISKSEPLNSKLGHWWGWRESKRKITEQAARKSPVSSIWNNQDRLYWLIRILVMIREIKCLVLGVTVNPRRKKAFVHELQVLWMDFIFFPDTSLT